MSEQILLFWMRTERPTNFCSALKYCIDYIDGIVIHFKVLFLLVIGNKVSEVLFGEDRFVHRLCLFFALATSPIDHFLNQIVFNSIPNQLFIQFVPFVSLRSTFTRGALRPHFLVIRCLVCKQIIFIDNNVKIIVRKLI